MRKTWLSRKAARTFSLRARADARSCPNGFSTTRRDQGPGPSTGWTSPASPRRATASPMPDGGMAR